MRPLGSAALRGPRRRLGVPALLLAVGIWNVAATEGWAAGRSLPEEAGTSWREAARQINLQDNLLRAPDTPQLGLVRLAAKAHPPQAAPPPLPPQLPKPRPQGAEPKQQRQQDAPKASLKDAEPKQGAAKPLARDPEPKRQKDQNTAKPPPTLAVPKPQQQQETSKQSPRASEPTHKVQQQDVAKKSPKESEPKQHDAAKQPPRDIDPKQRLRDEAKRLEKDPDPKPKQHEMAKEGVKDAGKQHKQDTAKEESKDSGKHQKQDTAKEDTKQSGKHKQDTVKADPKDSEKHHKQDTAKEDSKDSGKQRKQDTAKENSKAVEAKQPTQLTQAAPAQTQAQAPALPPAQLQPAKAAQPVPATAAQPIQAPQPTPAQTDTTTADAKPTTDAKPTSQDTAPADARPLDAKVADAPQSAGSFDRPYGLGGPVDRDSKDDPQKTKLADAKKPTDDRVPTIKPGERGGVIRIPSLPPVADSYKQSELLLANPSREVLAEMARRRYGVPVDSGSMVLITLPPGAPSAWEVQRELEAKFPSQKLGLNFIYKPYHPQDGVKSPLSALPRADLLKLIGWDEKANLAACAVNLKIGMIDTLVNKKSHPTFANTNLESVNLALKHDAPPAPHWHAMGVLSVMAGLPTNTPALIPGAAFTAVNVFFTNKEGQLETDTAHLTEALAYLDEKIGVQIVNMSIAGPQDPLVYDRIKKMAEKGVVFVAAAGNGGPDAAPSYPAAYEQVIAVTAVDRKGGNYDHANRGTYIDVAAPGVQIRAALPEGKEGALSGTSFATPIVTALAAVAYQDSGLDRAVKARQTPLNPKSMVLAHLLGKNQTKKLDSIYGYGLIKAPERCGEQRWISTVTPLPPAPALQAPVVFGSWKPAVMATAGR